LFFGKKRKLDGNFSVEFNQHFFHLIFISNRNPNAINDMALNNQHAAAARLRVYLIYYSLITLLLLLVFFSS
jgi:hypothetical protein